MNNKNVSLHLMMKYYYKAGHQLNLKKEIKK